jgi:hypothetical protein
MSLTLVGHAFTCLVADSPRARWSAAWCAGAAPDQAECGVGLQQSSDRPIFPLAGDVFQPARMSAGGRRPGVKPAGTEGEQQAP